MGRVKSCHNQFIAVGLAAAQEELTFMAAIAKCMDCADAKPAAITKPILTTSSILNSLSPVCFHHLQNAGFSQQGRQHQQN